MMPKIFGPRVVVFVTVALCLLWTLTSTRIHRSIFTIKAAIFLPPDPNAPQPKSVSYDHIEHKIPPSDLSLNYHLWSPEPDSVNWTEPISMCESILESGGNVDESVLDAGSNWTLPNIHDDKSIANLLSNCNEFFKKVPFANVPMSKEESEYPSAYVFMGSRNAAQTVRLFRMIYQPQNVYCMAYDNGSAEDYILAFKRLVECFPDSNVVMTPQPEHIGYGQYALLHSELTCLKVLLEMWDRVKWKYVQIISWNDMPLRTNGELVEIFKIFNGSLDSPLQPLTLGHFTHPYRAHTAPPPGNLTLYKGSHATTMTKEFIEFVFSNPTTIKFNKWMEGTYSSIETYWSTIIHNTHLNAPGAFPGQCQHYYEYRKMEKPWAGRYEVWRREAHRCKGKIVNYSCLFGFRDLLVLLTRPEFVVHKIYEEFQPATNFCLERLYWKSVKSSVGRQNLTYYQQFPSVRYQNMENKENFQCLEKN